MCEKTKKNWGNWIMLYMEKVQNWSKVDRAAK